jgi:regulator of RNase E activity RraA
VLHPEIKMAGRAFSVMFMPTRPDLDSIITASLHARGIPTLNNQYVIEMLQPGDVLVVDLCRKHEGGTIVGDNPFFYIMKATKGGGLVFVRFGQTAGSLAVRLLPRRAAFVRRFVSAASERHYAAI